MNEFASQGLRARRDSSRKKVPMPGEQQTRTRHLAGIRDRVYRSLEISRSNLATQLEGGEDACSPDTCMTSLKNTSVEDRC